MTKGIKNSNIICINLNEKAVICLQKLEFLNGKKKNTGKRSISNFVSKLIIDFVNLNHPDWNRYIEKKVLISELKELSVKRDNIENDMKLIASKVSSLKEIENNEEK